MNNRRQLQLITNADGRLSTTGTIQFFGFIILSGVLFYSVWLDRFYVPELFTAFAVYCGGMVVSKGAVGVFAERRRSGSDHSQNEWSDKPDHSARVWSAPACQKNQKNTERGQEW